MPRRLLPFAAIACLALTGCGGGDTPAPAAQWAEQAAPSTVDAEAYTDQVVTAFRSTYASSPPIDADADDEAVTADWSAFTATIEKLDPPAGDELAHERMVAGFRSYVDLREETGEVCDETPGPGGPCFTAVSKELDQWSAALDRAYELPGLSWETLLG